MRDSAIVYRSYREAISELPDKQRLHIWEAILDFAFDGKETDLCGAEKAVFTLIKPQIIANNKRYENGKKGAEYGKQGGRPPKTKPQYNPETNGDETPNKPLNNPNKTPNVNDNVNDIINTHTPRARAREEFVSAYTIRDDAGVLEEVAWDFDALAKAYGESGKFLAIHPVARCTSWIAKHYTSIITGKYKDIAMPTTLTQKTDADSGRVVYERLTAEQLDGMFTDITEDDE